MRLKTRHTLFRAILMAPFCCISPSLAAQESSEKNVTPPENTIKCLQAADIIDYKVVSDEIVHFMMKGPKNIQMRFKRHCPQLYFHKYVAYTPVNGKLCARFDNILTRSGTPCRIASFTEIDKNAD